MKNYRASFHKVCQILISAQRKERRTLAVIAQHQWIVMQEVLKYEQKQSSIQEEIVKAANTVADIGKTALKKLVSLFTPHTLLASKKAST